MSAELVVDACIAIDAEKAFRRISATPQIAQKWLDSNRFLVSMRSFSVVAVFTTELLGEWNVKTPTSARTALPATRRHSSRSSIGEASSGLLLGWMVDMLNVGLIRNVGTCQDRLLRVMLLGCKAVKPKKPYEDVTLVEAAALTGALVVSSDPTACRRFQNVSNYLSARKCLTARKCAQIISDVGWVNPCCREYHAETARKASKHSIQRKFRLGSGNSCC